MRAEGAMARVLNFILAQAGWFACVEGAARGWPWIGPLAAAVIAIRHLMAAQERWSELRLLAAAVIAGLIVDGGLKGGGVVAYAGDVLPVRWLAPPWILALWVLFGTMLNGSLAWLHRRPGLAALLGAVFGPLSYLSGARLDAASFPRSGALAMAVLALVWAALLPALIGLAGRSSGRAR